MLLKVILNSCSYDSAFNIISVGMGDRGMEKAA
jgi:hypothetical protein